MAFFFFFSFFVRNGLFDEATAKKGRVIVAEYLVQCSHLAQTAQQGDNEL